MRTPARPRPRLGQRRLRSVQPVAEEISDGSVLDRLPDCDRRDRAGAACDRVTRHRFRAPRTPDGQRPARKRLRRSDRGLAGLRVPSCRSTMRRFRTASRRRSACAWPGTRPRRSVTNDITLSDAVHDHEQHRGSAVMYGQPAGRHRDLRVPSAGCATVADECTTMRASSSRRASRCRSPCRCTSAACLRLRSSIRGPTSSIAQRRLPMPTASRSPIACQSALMRIFAARVAADCDTDAHRRGAGGIADGHPRDADADRRPARHRHPADRQRSTANDDDGCQVAPPCERTGRHCRCWSRAVWLAFWRCGAPRSRAGVRA